MPRAACRAGTDASHDRLRCKRPRSAAASGLAGRRPLSARSSHAVDVHSAVARDHFRTKGATRTPSATNACANTKAGLAALDPRHPVFARFAHRGDAQRARGIDGGRLLAATRLRRASKHGRVGRDR